MRTIVGRLTGGYAVALTATLFVFSVTIYVIQAPGGFAEIDDRLQVEADLIANILLSSSSIGSDFITLDANGRAYLASRVTRQLETVEDYVVVTDTIGQPWYTAGPAASLTFAGDTLVITGTPSEEAGNRALTIMESLARVASDSSRGFGMHDGGPQVGLLRFYRRSVALGAEEARILAAAPAAGLTVGPGRLLIGMLVAGPIILVASILVGFLVAGRTLKPMDVIINEIQAITDGRSLHKRVVEFESTEELARLTTTLNNMLMRLERSFLSLRRFTADASHELKTPLTVLRSGVERAITHPGAPRGVLQVLEESLVEVNRMTELVDSLLMLARADEGRAPLHLEKADIRGVLAEVTETANILGEQAQVNVSAALPTKPIYVAMDRGRVRQLFMNLLTNAIKYTGKGGKVAIRCSELDGRFVFAVKDTGLGIARSELPYIFDRFWRADVARSRTGARPGAGLGLAICKWIAEAHGGSIAVESRRGRGSTFTVTLPLGDDWNSQARSA